MAYTTFITLEEFQSLRKNGEEIILVDCRYDLSDPTGGRSAYRIGHIPGAFKLGDIHKQGQIFFPGLLKHKIP